MISRRGILAALGVTLPLPAIAAPKLAPAEPAGRFGQFVCRDGWWVQISDEHGPIEPGIRLHRALPAPGAVAKSGIGW